MRNAAVVALAATIAAPAGVFKKKKYENPITKDTQQPDKVLFDKAVKDIEKGRYEIARLTLNTLINTYDTSEFLAKAKLAIADSWFREAGTHGYAQAEAEYKDFILFYPTMEEAAEAQNRVCTIHVKQMEKVDRDNSQALRAEQECRQLMTQFPNSKYAPIAEQRLREIQEALAEGETQVGVFYHNRGSNPAAANRLQGVISHYPLYSGAPEALWVQADSYSKMGKNFRAKAGEAYQKIVRDYPLSRYVDPAKKRLKDLEMEVPEADPVAVARMKYEQENYVKPNIVKRNTAFLRRGPDMSHAAKSGSPAMTGLRPTVPASIPIPAESLAAGPTSTDVTISTGVDNKTSSLDTKPDARLTPPTASGTVAAASPNAQPAGPDPLPVNHTGKTKAPTIKGKGQAPSSAKDQSATAAKKTKKDSAKKKDAKKQDAKKQQKSDPASKDGKTPPAATAAATAADSAKK